MYLIQKLDNMLSINIKTPQEIMRDIASRAKMQRLALGLTQEGLAERSGVSFGSIKRFENTGKIALESLLKVAVALGVQDDFDSLFTRSAMPANPSLDSMLKVKKSRKRGKKI